VGESGLEVGGMPAVECAPRWAPHKCEFNNARKLILSRRQRKAKNKSTMQ